MRFWLINFIIIKNYVFVVTFNRYFRDVWLHLEGLQLATSWRFTTRASTYVSFHMLIRDYFRFDSESTYGMVSSHTNLRWFRRSTSL